MTDFDELLNSAGTHVDGPPRHARSTWNARRWILIGAGVLTGAGVILVGAATAASLTP